jgi:hypothetical protein
MLVLMLGVAGRAARLLHIGADHGNDGVIGEPPLSGTVIVEDVTKPKLALLHQKAPERDLTGGKRNREGAAILAELLSARQ